MTLKERFKDISEIRNYNHFDILTKKLVKIADNYAIGFAEWITKAELPLQELLEIYKKEKGL